MGRRDLGSGEGGEETGWCGVTDRGVVLTQCGHTLHKGTCVGAEL